MILLKKLSFSTMKNSLVWTLYGLRRMIEPSASAQKFGSVKTGSDKPIRVRPNVNTKKFKPGLKSRQSNLSHA